MLKKILVLLIAVTVILTGCGKGSNKEEQGNQNDKQQEKSEIGEDKKEQADENKDKNKDIEKAETVEGLSDDLYSFQFSLDGKVYTLPCEFKELQDNGWEIEDYTEDFKLAPNQYSIGTYITKDGISLSTGFINFSKNEVTLDQCSIGEISIDEYLEDKHADFSIAKGIKVGSTREDVKAAFGEPTESYEGDSTDDYTYSTDIYVEAKITIDNKTDKVCGIDLENLTDTGNTASTESNDSATAEMPEDMPSYSAPTELTDDLFSFNVKFGGNMYTLPAPISEFLNNGWVIASSDSNTVAAKDTLINGVNLRKENVTFEANVYNPSSQETALNNCYVTSLVTSADSGTIDILLPKNISLNSTGDDLEKAYKDVDCQKEDSNSYVYYTYGETYEHRIEIVVDKETGKIASIEMNNYLD